MPDIRIKAVFFDAAGTLFDVRKGVGFHYSRIARKHGVQIPASVLEEQFSGAFPRMPPLHFPGVDSSDLLRQERVWWRALVRAVFRPELFDDFDTFFEEVYSLFGRAEAWFLFPEVMGTLTDLAKQGYRLGIVSNFDSRLHPVCEGLGIAPFFETILYSSGAWSAKPSPDIFRQALGQVGLSAAEVLYIGDSPKYDLPGPKTLGMPALLIDRTGKYPDIDAVRITTLSEIFGPPGGRTI